MSRQRFTNIYYLGIKELRSLGRDPVLVLLIIWAFSFGIYSVATGESQELHNAPIAIVDEDHSMLSQRIINAFYGPYFKTPDIIRVADIDPGLDSGLYTFVLDIPPDFERDVRSGRQPELQINVDATRMSQAFIGAGYIENIVTGEINEFMLRYRAATELPIGLATRIRFNPTLNGSWFGGVMEIINQITMLSVILTGAALIREREHGTLEHLLVMPLRPMEIMLSKVWAMALVVLVAAALSLRFVVQTLLEMPIAGSVPLFLFGAMLHLFSTTSLGILLGTVARTMPQLGLLVILIIISLQMLSGSNTPYESMPETVQTLMLLAPTTHFVSFAQAILFRGAGLDIVWPSFLAVIASGTLFFLIALALFRRTVTLKQM